MAVGSLKDNPLLKQILCILLLDNLLPHFSEVTQIILHIEYHLLFLLQTESYRLNYVGVQWYYIPEGAQFIMHFTLHCEKKSSQIRIDVFLVLVYTKFEFMLGNFRDLPQGYGVLKRFLQTISLNLKPSQISFKLLEFYLSANTTLCQCVGVNFLVDGQKLKQDTLLGSVSVFNLYWVNS